MHCGIDPCNGMGKCFIKDTKTADPVNTVSPDHLGILFATKQIVAAVSNDYSVRTGLNRHNNDTVRLLIRSDLSRIERDHLLLVDGIVDLAEILKKILVDGNILLIDILIELEHRTVFVMTEVKELFGDLLRTGLIDML